MHKATGERTTDFIDVVAWRQTAEFVCRYFAKGRMAVVEGRLQIRDWTSAQKAQTLRRLRPRMGLFSRSIAMELTSGQSQRLAGGVGCLNQSKLRWEIE